jgi:hypothetical protein
MNAQPNAEPQPVGAGSGRRGARQGIPNRGLLPVRVFVRALPCDPGLTQRTKIEQRIGSSTPENGHSESKANDPYKARDDDPNRHG